MSRSSVLLSLLPLLLLLGAAAAAAKAVPAENDTLSSSCSPQDCTLLDLRLLREYVNSLNITEPPSIEGAIEPGGVVESLPFGALASDWTRLLLLESRQPEGSPLRNNLMILARLVLAAYLDGRGWDVPNTIDHQWPKNDFNSTSGSRLILETESEDQQANNATLGLTTQKKSTWINAGTGTAATSGTTPVNDNATQPSSRNSTGYEERDDSAAMTSSFYPDPSTATFSLEAANFNQTTTAAFNKTDGSDFSSDAQDLASTENSQANEALHERSKEDFLVSRHRAKADKKYETVAAATSDESRASNYITSVERFFATEESPRMTETNKSSADGATSDERKNSSERLRKSPENSLGDVNNSDDDANNNNNNNTDKDSDNWSTESDSFEFNSTKSIEELFAALDGNSTTKQPEEVDIEYEEKEEEEPTLSPSEENFFATEELPANQTEIPNANRIEIANSSSLESGEILVTKSLEAEIDALDASESNDTSREKLTASFEILFNETEQITTQLPGSLSSDFRHIPKQSVKLNQTESSSWLELKNSTATESSLNGTIFYPNFENFTNMSSDAVNNAISNYSVAKIKKDEESSTMSSAYVEMTTDSVLLNFTQVEKGDENKPSTTIKMTTTSSGLTFTKFPVMIFSNEITSTVLNRNGNGDRYTKYFDTSATPTPSLVANTTDTAEKTRKLKSKLEDNGSQTNESNDYLFKEITREERREDHHSSSEPVALINPAFSSEVETVSPHTLLRRMLMTFRHEPRNGTTAPTNSGKLSPPEAPFRTTDASDSWDEWHGHSVEPASATLRNKRDRRSSGISTTGVRAKKRKFLKLADAGRRYRAF